MSETPVTWTDLEKFCAEKQHQCHQLLDERSKTHALRIETERRAGMSEVEDALKALRLEVGSLKQLFDSRAVWVLPRPILALLCVGMIAVGVAGEKVITLAVKYFGGP